MGRKKSKTYINGQRLLSEMHRAGYDYLTLSTECHYSERTIRRAVTDNSAEPALIESLAKILRLSPYYLTDSRENALYTAEGDTLQAYKQAEKDRANALILDGLSAMPFEDNEDATGFPVRYDFRHIDDMSVETGKRFTEYLYDCVSSWLEDHPEMKER